MKTIRLMVLGILILSSSLISNVYSQDIIIKTNGDEIKAKVLEVTPEIVKYNKYDYLDGPIYSIYIEDITKIIYSNGSEDVFNHTDNNVYNENVSDSKDGEKIKDIFIDERDGKEYKIVKIGDRWWMAENLNYKTKKSSCNNIDKTKCKECGQHYIFDEAQAVCPQGWHLPSDDEWMKLEIAVGMSNVEARKRGWRGTEKGQALELLTDGGSGFELGFCGKEDQYSGFKLPDEGFYWTSTIKDSYSDLWVSMTVWARHFKIRASIDRDGYLSDNKFNVRCIKNNE